MLNLAAVASLASSFHDPIPISIAPPQEFCVSEDGPLYEHIVSHIVQTEFVFGSVPAWEIDSAPSVHFRRLPFCISGKMSRLYHNY